MFEMLLRCEATHQNLIAASTIDDVRDRHTTDSLQLVTHLPANTRDIVDVGSGAGFPGMVLAIALRRPVMLVEPRALRAGFLRDAAAQLGLGEVEVFSGRVEALLGRQFDVITARAVATLDRLLGMTHHLAHRTTTWLLPKGRSVQDELAVARRSWQGDFEVRPSLTSAEAGIIVARNVRPRRAA